MVRALERKLVRALWRLRGQVLTIALVVAAGITGYAALHSTYRSLMLSRDAYYDAYRLGDVFVHLRRAPEEFRNRLEAIPGVAQVYVRLLEYVRLPLNDEPQPPIATLVTLPGGTAPLNRVRLEQGRLPVPGRGDEALLLQGFADRRGIVPGDTLPAVIQGVRRILRIVGLANSPEFIYPVQPGAVSFDQDRAAVLWMDRSTIAPAFEMEGAFNDVVFRLQAGASDVAVMAEVDRALDRWGGLGSVSRAHQMSSYVLNGELEQLRSYATVVPTLFLGVSAFLLNVVLARMIELERGQIATLKAIGYANREVAGHYLGFVTAIALLGAGLGLALGAWLGWALTDLYGHAFHLPLLVYRVDLPVLSISLVACLAAAMGGALFAAYRVMRLSPAEAMRPPTPFSYRPLIVDRLGLGRLVTQGWRMTLRELERVPLRTVLSIAAIAAATGLIVVGRFMDDGIEYLLATQFGMISRQDLTVELTDAAPERAVRELGALPGVLRSEGLRAVPVRISMGSVQRDVPLIGLSPNTELRQVMDWQLKTTPLSPRGVVLTRKLAQILGVERGDTVAVKVLQGERIESRIVVGGLIDEMFGLQGYLPRDGLHRLLREGPMVTQVMLRIDRSLEADLRARLADVPGIASVSSVAADLAHVRRQLGSTMTITMWVITLFAVSIAVGVVYNNARIALSMRSRDLAMLRVIGFSRAEISRFLLGEFSLAVALAIVPGCWFGRWLTVLIMGTVDPEQYRWPVVVSDDTYAFAAIIVIAAGAVSALAVRRHLDRLDLIGVLKSRQ